MTLLPPTTALRPLLQLHLMVEGLETSSSKWRALMKSPLSEKTTKISWWFKWKTFSTDEDNIDAGHNFISCILNL